MNKERLKKFIGTTSMTIVDAMGKIDTNAKGILFIVDAKEVLVGCITDGDIRRWILKTGDLSSSVEEAMMPRPKFLWEEEKKNAERLMIQKRITAVPILNQQRNIVDLVFLSDEMYVKSEKEKKNLRGVPVVVMAGGKGTRLYPYTKILPKPLIPIGETPIVERIINAYVEYGIDKFYMTVNYKKGMIKSYFADVAPDYSIVYVEEEKPLGTGGSIKLIEESFDRPLFIANCDALILADYGDIYDFHIKSGNAITMVSALKNITVPYGVLHSGDNGTLLSMEEKPKLSYFINTGMYVMDPKMIEKIPNDTMFHMPQLVDAVMKDGGKVGAYPISEDSFLDMGEFNEMRRMEEKLHIVTEQ